MKYRTLLNYLACLGILAAAAGCETKAGTGAAVGGAGGAALGAIIGHQSGHAGAGAVIGGLVGAGGGYVVGNEMDKADARRDTHRRDDYAQASTGTYRATKQDVINWTMRNTSDEVIIQRIRSSGSVFHLTDRDIRELRDNGVSERVIAEMQATAR